MTVNGTAVSLGGSITITANNPNALTIGTGLTGTSYNGSSAVTIAVDTSTIATRAYVDGLVQGMSWKSPVRVRVTSNVTVSNPGTAVFDGVTLSNGDRVLLGGQTAAAENGIYVFNGSAAALTRATDADTATELRAAAVLVESGTSADQQFVQTADSITLGTTNLSFSQVGGGSGGVTGISNNGTGAAVLQSVAGSTLNARTLIATAQTGLTIGITTNTNDLTFALSGVTTFAQGGTGADLSGLTTGALLKKGIGKKLAGIGGTILGGLLAFGHGHHNTPADSIPVIEIPPPAIVTPEPSARDLLGFIGGCVLVTLGIIRLRREYRKR